MTYSDPVRIRGLLRSYQWGSTTRFQELVGIDSSQPLAELWFSCDSDGFSRQQTLRPLGVVASVEKPTAAAAIFPFKAKLLAIASPLSIQVHPDDIVSARYWERSDAAFASVTSPLGKFETLLALEPTELVAGPADPAQVEALLPASIQADVDYRSAFAASPHAAFAQLLKRIEGASRFEVAEFAQRIAGSSSEYPVLAAHLSEAMERFDRSPLVMDLASMQHRSLQVGERVHIRPGVAHCYLSGFGLEITAGSENIARYGLTDKPVNRALFYESLRPEDPTYEAGCCALGIDLEIMKSAALRPGLHQLWIPLDIGSRIELRNAAPITPGEALLIPAGVALPGLSVVGRVGSVSWHHETD